MPTKFTMALVPGSIGVRSDQRETIRLAAQYGFESVAPSAEFLAELSAAEMEDPLAEPRRNEVWLMLWLR